jgi:hypothetical protein
MFDYTKAEAILSGYREHEPNIYYLEKAVGGLSKTSKMPWLSYSIPASKCITGSKLRQIPGSVCSDCYACKGRYVMSNVEKAQLARYDILSGDLEKWAADMAALLWLKSRRRDKDTYFRWHDSGDIQSQDHLRAIIWIARQVSNVQFWLPTKELGMLQSEREAIASTPNLTARFSAPMIGQVVSVSGWPTSSVDSGIGYKCPAPDNAVDGVPQCGECRACWDVDVANVDYHQH